MQATIIKGRKNIRGDATSVSVIVALIVLLVGLYIAYTFLRDYADPLLNSKLGSLFKNAKFG